jgi:DNA-binding NarL/FixJ family response regulator
VDNDATEGSAHTRRAALSVGIVDDHQLLADSLALSLSQLGFDVATLRPLSEDEVITFARSRDLGVVLLDLHLDGVGTSLGLIPRLECLGCKVVVLTGETHAPALGECIEAGAEAVVTKTVSFDELVRRVTRILDGPHDLLNAEREELLGALRRQRAEEQQRLEPFYRLSSKECEVLSDLCRGISAGEIAEARYLSTATVRSHIRSILLKLEVNSQLAAVALATRNGWQPSASSRSH